MKRRITVFCSSSSDIDAVYLDAANALGQGIAENGWELIYGGNRLGAMAILADACREAGGTVIGITPQLFVDKGFADTLCHELLITPDMRSRRAMMEEMADAFVCLPGGFGTLEEVSEILVSRLLNCHAKPLIIASINQFYDPLLQLFDRMVSGGFAKDKARYCYDCTPDIPRTLSLLNSRFAQPNTL